MDQTELHYLTYDADAIMKEMHDAYTEAGGETLWPGDEKEILLHAVLDVMVQAFAGIDNALRMDTLRYAVRDYLDVYGEKRGCERITAQAARATVTLTFLATGAAATIPAGTGLTPDGEIIYLTDDDISLTGGAQSVSVNVTCSKTGSVGNGLVSGDALQPLDTIDGLTLALCTVSASGGQEAEDDDTYRERIRTWGLSQVTTGPKEQYEAAAMAVSSEIIDAAAVKTGDGEVTVYIIPKSDTGLAALLAAVEAALNDTSARPLTDSVTAARATAVPYTLIAQVVSDGSSAVQSAMAAAVTEYQDWQDGNVGTAFNPDKLMAMLYQAGATRVTWGSGSSFDGGAVAYTEIEANEHCSGSITLVTA